MNEDRYAEYGDGDRDHRRNSFRSRVLIVTPLPPDLNAPVDECSQHYHDHDGAIRAGLMLGQ
jgi:hypothetical protein